jgi:hypothetical protein
MLLEIETKLLGIVANEELKILLFEIIPVKFFLIVSVELSI